MSEKNTLDTLNEEIVRLKNENNKLRYCVGSAFSMLVMNEAETSGVDIRLLLSMLVTEDSRLLDMAPEDVPRDIRILASELKQLSNYYSGFTMSNIAGCMQTWKLEHEVVH